MKKALLVVSYGTSYKETREKTIDVCEQKIKDTLTEYDFYRAYTSEKITEKIQLKEGIKINTPIEALEKLLEKGYEEVIVQSLHIICGDEFHSLKEVVEEYKYKFRRIILGRPLLSSMEDYKEVAVAIESQVVMIDQKESLVLMGHGMENGSNYNYVDLESILRIQGMNAYVGTIEGRPGLHDVIEKLKVDEIKTVHLMPMMLVVGYHVQKDMVGKNESSWINVLKSKGFNVKVHLKGLGENPLIQDKFVRHAQECLIEE